MARYAFEFTATGSSLRLCERIVGRMVELFGISVEEAVGRINQQWAGLEFEDLDLICHEDQDFWANDMYYGHGSHWWRKPPGLKPMPYP